MQPRAQKMAVKLIVHGVLHSNSPRGQTAVKPRANGGQMWSNRGQTPAKPRSHHVKRRSNGVKRRSKTAAIQQDRKTNKPLGRQRANGAPPMLAAPCPSVWPTLKALAGGWRAGGLKQGRAAVQPQPPAPSRVRVLKTPSIGNRMTAGLKTMMQRLP